MKNQSIMVVEGLQRRYESKGGVKSVIFLVASFLFGAGSLLLWVTFLSRGALGVVDLGLGPVGTLFFDGVLCLMFFAQHSTMVRPSFKKRLGRWIGQEYHGAAYAIASGVVVSGLVLLWQGPVRTFIVLGDIGRAVIQVASLSALAGFIWGVASLGGFDMLGSVSIIRSLRGRAPSVSGPLTVRGPYRFVRHPLYLFCLIAIWSVAEISVDRLLYNILWTGWIVVGTVLEERDLVAVFGDAYHAYRAKVPMLFPWKRPADSTSGVPLADNSATGGV